LVGVFDAESFRGGVKESVDEEASDDEGENGEFEEGMIMAEVLKLFFLLLSLFHCAMKMILI
jgi:hypothetical protein